MVISGKKQGNSGSDKPVQDRLLDSAEQLFADHGFEGTSVRDIAADAGCNIAAVNYHFGGKEKLYRKVFQRQLTILRNVRIAGINKVMAEHGDKITLEILLHAFAEVFLEPLVTQSSGRSFMKLMMNEILDPHLPADMFLNETVIPVVNSLQGAIKKIYSDLTDESALYSIRSIIAQLIYTIHLQEMFKNTDTTFMNINLEESVEHIVKFSAAGIRYYTNKD